MFVIIINTRLGAVSQPTITKSSVNAIDWKDDGPIRVNPIEVANTNSIVKIFPIIWAILAGISLIIIIVWRGLSKKYGSNNTSSVNNSGNNATNATNATNGRPVNVLKARVATRQNIQPTKNNTKSCSFSFYRGTVVSRVARALHIVINI